VHDLDVAIGGVGARLTSASAAVIDVARTCYAGFLGSAPTGWRVHLDTGRPLQPGADLEATVLDGTLALSRSDFLAHLEPGRRSGRATLVDADRIALEAFLRVMWSIALPEAGGLLLHAASIDRGGRAFVFAGRSGSGKTTIARLSSGDEALSDEMSLVRLTASGAACHGTPFSGDLGIPGPNRAVPLAAVCAIEHGERHALVHQRPAEALRTLLPHVVHFVREPGLTARVFGIAARLVEQVPCFRLSFRPDPGLWELLDAI
jgi:hypothetical protein